MISLADQPSRRWSAAILLPSKLETEQRLKLIALMTLLCHYRRFATERIATTKMIRSAPADADIVRRAAFWEPCDSNLQTAGALAIEKLATRGTESAQRDLAAIFLSEDTPSAAVLTAAGKSIETGQKTFTHTLLHYLSDYTDKKAQWAGRILCQAKDTRALPVMIAWLSEGKAATRASAAFNLCWLPSG